MQTLYDTRQQSITSESITEATQPVLSHYVEQAMQAYFAQLGDIQPAALYQMVLAEVERPLLQAILRHTGFNRLQAAKQLGISRTTFHKKLRQHALETWITDTKYRDLAAVTENLKQSNDSDDRAE